MRSWVEDYPHGGYRGALAPPASDHIDVRVLAAGTPEAHTIPAGARYVVFAANADFVARFGAAAAWPSADVTDGTGSHLNPNARRIPDGVTTIGLAANAACIVTMAFYN